MFGADMLIAEHAKGLACARRPYAVLMGTVRASLRAQWSCFGRANTEDYNWKILRSFEGLVSITGPRIWKRSYCGGKEVMVVGAQLCGQAAVFSGANDQTSLYAGSI